MGTPPGVRPHYALTKLGVEAHRPGDPKKIQAMKLLLRSQRSRFERLSFSRRRRASMPLGVVQDREPSRPLPTARLLKCHSDGRGPSLPDPPTLEAADAGYVLLPTPRGSAVDAET